MDLPEHTRVGNYEVIGRLGSGAMATVYKVRHVQLEAVYALKVLDQVGGRLQDRLIQEGRVQAQLRHPNIVSVTDVVEVEGQPALVMEFVDGPTLSQHLRQHHPLSWEALDGLVKPILRGVRAAHRLGHVHRDLKPANVLLARLDDEWVPKIADFGLVKALGVTSTTTATRSGAILGSPAYMAPEQTLSSRTVDERADVWALGAMLYQLVTGRLAFEHDDFVEVFSMVRRGTFVEPRALRPDLPERMRDAILGAMTVDPDQRIRDCDELLAVWEGREARRRTVVASTETLTAGQFTSGKTAAVSEQSAGSLETMALALDGTGPRIMAAPDEAVRREPPAAESMSEALVSLAVGERPAVEASDAGVRRRVGLVTLLVVTPVIVGIGALVGTAGLGSFVFQERAALPAKEGAPEAAPEAPAGAVGSGLAVPVAPTAPIAPNTLTPPTGPVTPEPLSPAPSNATTPTLAAEPPRKAPPAPTAPVEPTGSPMPAAVEPAAPAAPPAPALGAPPAAAVGTFALTGQAEAAWLVRGGTYFEPGEVEAGTYTVVARFPGRPAAPVDGLVVRVEPGATLTLSCAAGFLTCKAK